jgi:hypothetical protein
MESSALAGSIVQAMQLVRDDGTPGSPPPGMPHPPPDPPSPPPAPVMPPPIPQMPVASPWGGGTPG